MHCKWIIEPHQLLVLCFATSFVAATRVTEMALQMHESEPKSHYMSCKMLKTSKESIISELTTAMMAAEIENKRVLKHEAHKIVALEIKNNTSVSVALQPHKRSQVICASEFIFASKLACANVVHKLCDVFLRQLAVCRHRHFLVVHCVVHDKHRQVVLRDPEELDCFARLFDFCSAYEDASGIECNT